MAGNEQYTWHNLLQPIEDLEDELAQAWSPVSHLNSVHNSDALREAYNACLPLLSGTAPGWASTANVPPTSRSRTVRIRRALDTAQRKSIEHALGISGWPKVAHRRTRSTSTDSCASACRNWAASSGKTYWTPPMPGPGRLPARNWPACLKPPWPTPGRRHGRRVKTAT
ncbi:MAG: hypothetical protein R3E50_16350 [Halioglobus sp.]